MQMVTCRLQGVQHFHYSSHKRLDRYRTNAIILFIAVKKGVLYTSVSSLPYKKKVRISREFQ